MEIPFATQNRTRVDACFGWARPLAVHELTAESARHDRVHSFAAGEEGEDEIEPRLSKALGKGGWAP
jgi:hypothetical protein